MNKKYQVILADPPWRYDFSKDNADKIEQHYPTMSLEEICSLQPLAEDNSVLYLWATAPKLLEAFEVMERWGFTYKTHAIWDKGWVGMGYWFRGQHELLLVGTRGSFSPPEETKRISSVIRSKKSQHSTKPDYVRQMITEWYPNKSKLEMFARQDKRNLFQQDIKHWDVWGNEVESDIDLTKKNNG